jgi:hypothetical protein
MLIAIRPGEGRLTVDQPIGNVGTLPDPTQIAYDGKRLLIVADSGWATLDKPGFKRQTGAPILAIPLKVDCTPE